VGREGNISVDAFRGVLRSNFEEFLANYHKNLLKLSRSRPRFMLRGEAREKTRARESVALEDFENCLIADVTATINHLQR